MNYFVEDLHISWTNQKCDCQIYNLQSKFPNITNLEITSKNFYDNKLSTLEIKENPESKINKISISGQNKNIKLYIESFENLKYIFLNFINEIKNIEDTFPFFRNICNTEFNSFNSFCFFSKSFCILLYLLFNISIFKSSSLFLFSNESII